MYNKKRFTKKLIFIGNAGVSTESGIQIFVVQQVCVTE